METHWSDQPKLIGGERVESIETTTEKCQLAFTWKAHAKADLDVKTFAYNYRMQPAHAVHTTRIASSKSAYNSLTTVACNTKKVVGFWNMF